MAWDADSIECSLRFKDNKRIIRVYHLFSLTQLYLPSVIEYNTTCFGPRCWPSSGVTYRLSYTRCMGEAARSRFVLDGVFFMYVSMSFTENRFLHNLKLIRY